jgi:hypothetical protein
LVQYSTVLLENQKSCFCVICKNYDDVVVVAAAAISGAHTQAFLGYL